MGLIPTWRHWAFPLILKRCKLKLQKEKKNSHVSQRKFLQSGNFGDLKRTYLAKSQQKHNTHDTFGTGDRGHDVASATRSPTASHNSSKTTKSLIHGCSHVSCFSALVPILRRSCLWLVIMTARCAATLLGMTQHERRNCRKQSFLNCVLSTFVEKKNTA